MSAFNNWSFWTALPVFSHEWEAMASRRIWTIFAAEFRMLACRIWQKKISPNDVGPSYIDMLCDIV